MARDTIKGLALMALFSIGAFLIAQIPVIKQLSLSPLIIGIILGMIYANTFRSLLPESYAHGLKICTKQILRTGIVLFGFRLTLNDVILVGLPAILVDIIIVAGTLILGIVLGKLLKLDHEIALMTATGSSICGAAAVLGAESVVKCAPYKTAIAVSTVVIFGTIAMFLYPIMYRLGLLDNLGNIGTAIYTGATLHEVAHVAGAGNAMDINDNLNIAGTATITKMIRVMMLAPVLLIIGIMLNKYRLKKSAPQSHVHQDQGAHKIVIPYFAFIFILVIAFNTLLQNISGASTVKDIPFNGTIEYIDTFLLTMAMCALGADTSFNKFKQAGAKPFILALMLFIWLLVGGYLLTYTIVNI